MSKMNSKTEKVLKWLESGRTITAIQAFEKFQLMRLAAVIFELRSRGLEIETRNVRMNGSTYAIYSLKDR